MVAVLFKNFGKDLRGIRILELGCGAGNNLWFAARHGAEVVGIDGSESAIKFCKERFKKESLPGRFVVQSFENTSLLTDKYDLIIDRAALTTVNLETVKNVFNNIYFLLKETGFRALAAAHILSGRGHEIVLLGNQNALGGVLNGIKIEDERFDLGCHTFDNSDDIRTELIINLGGGESQFSPIDLSYNSLNDNGLTENLSVFDFNNFKENNRGKILNGFFDEVRLNKNVETFLDCLINHYGVTAARVLRPIIERHLVTPINKLDHECFDFSIFSRTRMFTNSITKELKRIKYFDKSLALPWLNNPLLHYPGATRYTFRNFYPKSGSTYNSCLKAKNTLRKVGVNFTESKRLLSIDGCKAIFIDKTDKEKHIRYDYLIWTDTSEELENIIFGTNDLVKLKYNVPMSLVYIILDKKFTTGLTYAHNFETSALSARISSPTEYNPQSKNKISYLCCECPTRIDSNLWRKSFDQIKDDLLNEAKKMGLINRIPKAISGYKVNVKRTFSLPLLGYTRVNKDLIEKTEKKFNNLSICGGLSGSKDQIINEMLDKFRHF